MKITNVKNLKTFLLKKGYHIIPLTLTRTNHFELTAHLNGIQGRFIVDTGASITCVGLDCIKHFNLIPELSEIKASGAGATNMETQISKKNILEIGPWQKKKVELVLFDLTHVNQALTQNDALPVHGIIGADVLKKSKAIIDYSKKRLYIK